MSENRAIRRLGGVSSKHTSGSVRLSFIEAHLARQHQLKAIAKIFSTKRAKINTKVLLNAPPNNTHFNKQNGRKTSPAPASALISLGKIPYVFAILFQALLIATIAPAGDFPLNDDWAYAHSVIWLIEENRIRLSNWIAMNLLPQTIIGTSASLAFGFSHSTLRITTEITSIATSLFTLYFFRSNSISSRDALFATCLLVSTPWWMAVSNSYMSDIYCMLFSIPAAHFYLKILHKKQKSFDLFLATALTIIAVLQRQVALVIPFAFLATHIFLHRKILSRHSLKSAIPLAHAVIAEVLYQQYLRSGPGLPEAQAMLHGRLVPMAIKLITLDQGEIIWFSTNVLQLLSYLGLATLAWGTWLGLGMENRRNLAFLLGGALFLSCFYFSAEILPPYRANNIVDAAGIGPFTIGNGLTASPEGLDRNNPFFWGVMALLAALGVSQLTVVLFRTARELESSEKNPKSVTAVFCGTLVAGYMIPFAITDFIDRYILYVIPFLYIWMHSLQKPAPQKALQRVAAAACMLLATTSALAAHDYFAWNRARWKMIHLAEQQLGATPRSLDGGFEYNGFYNHPKWNGNAEGKQWWWVYDDEYQIALEKRNNYKIISKANVDTRLPSSPKEILLLQRIN